MTEKKDRHVQLLFTPTLLEKVKAKAAENNISVNNLVNQLCEMIVEDTPKENDIPETVKKRKTRGTKNRISPTEALLITIFKFAKNEDFPNLPKKPTLGSVLTLLNRKGSSRSFNKQADYLQFYYYDILENIREDTKLMKDFISDKEIEND